MTAKLVGSHTTAASALMPERTKTSIPRLACSSSAVRATTNTPGSRSRATLAVAASKAATPPFMSHDPLPQSRPSLSSPPKGSTLIPATPTVSRWPFKRSVGPTPSPSRRPTTFQRPAATSDISTARPQARSHPAVNSATAASPAPDSSISGFTEGVATKARASATGSPAWASSRIRPFSCDMPSP